LERRPSENESQEKERSQDSADRKAKELEEIQKYITRQKEASREKATARAKKAILQKV
jgi:hypothetical protein